MHLGFSEVWKSPTLVMAREPLYRRLAEHLLQEVVSGRLKTGDKLLPEVELANALDVSRSTLREALGILEKEGFIRRMHGIGSFVTLHSQASIGGIESLESYAETIRRSGHAAEDVVIEVSLAEGGDEIAGSLDLTTASGTILIRSVRLADGVPVIYCQDFLVPEAVNNVDVDFVRTHRPKYESLLDFLENDVGLTLAYGTFVLHVEVADAEVARVLKVKRETPLLRLSGLVCDPGYRPLYYSVDHFLTSRYEFTLVRRKPLLQRAKAGVQKRGSGTTSGPFLHQELFGG